MFTTTLVFNNGESMKEFEFYSYDVLGGCLVFSIPDTDQSTSTRQVTKDYIVPVHTLKKGFEVRHVLKNS